MEVDDSESAIETLRRVNYYRLSGYWYPSRRRTSSGPEDASYPGTRFSDIVALYESGVRLRAATFAALAPIELAQGAEPRAQHRRSSRTAVQLRPHDRAEAAPRRAASLPCRGGDGMEPYFRQAHSRPVSVGPTEGGVSPDGPRRREDLSQRDDCPDLPCGSTRRLAGEYALSDELRVA